MNSPVSILASMLRAADGDHLSTLLPRADAQVDALIRKGASVTHANETAVALAGKHGVSYDTALRAVEAAGVSDPRVLNALIDARWNELDHAFALGLALGLRMGR